MKRLIAILMLCLPVTSLAQNQQKVDSLLVELQKHETQRTEVRNQKNSLYDTSKVRLLSELFKETLDYDHAKGLEYAKQCLEISERMRYAKGIAFGLYYTGVYYAREQNYKLAESYYDKALQLRKELHDSEGVSAVYNGLGLMYRDIGDEAKQIEYFLASLHYAEGCGSKRYTAAAYHNLAMVYFDAANYDNAIDYLRRAITINTQTENYLYLHNNYDMLDVVYSTRLQWDSALGPALSAYELGLKLHHPKTVVDCERVGTCYYYLKNYPEAARYWKTALETFEKRGDTVAAVQERLNVAGAYEKQRLFVEALRLLKSALSDAERLKDDGLLSQAYSQLAEYYGDVGNYTLAWSYHMKHKALSEKGDNVNHTQERVKALNRLLLQSSFDRQRDSTRAIQEKKDLVQSNIQTSILAALGGAILFLFVVYKQRNRIAAANNKNEELLLNILPAEVAEELKAKGHADARHFDNVTVLFTDFKSFTTFSEQLTPQELVNELHACFKAFDEICDRYGIEKIKTIGDAYLAVCGLPLADARHAEKVVRAALEIRNFMLERRLARGASTFECRIGINSGSVVAGIVGVKKYSYDIWGDTVNTAARMEQNGEAGKINISESTRELVQDLFSLEYRGEIDAKNKGKLKMYYVE